LEVLVVIPVSLAGLSSLLAVPALLFLVWVGKHFQRVLNRYAHIASANGFTGLTAARRILEWAGIRGVRVVPRAGLRISDHYHPLTRDLALSQGIYTGATLAAVSIAAHEAGHAHQHATGYFPLWLRTAQVPLGALLFIALVQALMDSALGYTLLAWAVLPLLGCCLVLPLATLLVEFDASRRARRLALAAGVIRPEEEAGMAEVLRAAALTYVARAAQLGVVLLVLAVVLVVDGVTDFLALPLIVFLVVAWLNLPLRKKSAAPAVRELNEHGALLYEQGQLAEAVAAFTKALGLDPRYVPAYLNRGAAYLRGGQYDEALADLNTAVRLAPDGADVYRSRGWVRLQRGELAQAQADFDEEVRRQPGSAAAYADRGGVWLMQGEAGRAIAEYDEALRRGGDRATILRDRGAAWILRGELDRAVAELDESLRLNDSDAVTFNNRGAALLKRGDYARAAADLGQALRLQPDLPNAYKNLAWLQATCPEPAFRNGAEAVANAARALRLTNGQPVAWLAILAAAHAEAGDFVEAARVQAQCLEQSPPRERAELQTALDLYRAQQPLRVGPAAARRTEAESLAVPSC
jgi:Zn-dependent membrane protease YugP/Flp pilus assembly protein TadD